MLSWWHKHRGNILNGPEYNNLTMIASGINPKDKVFSAVFGTHSLAITWTAT